MNLLQALMLSLGVSAYAHAADQFIWMEAESGAEFNPIVVKSDLAASQSIYLGSWKWADYGSRSAASGMVSFDVYIPEAGDYKLWARMRLPWSGATPYDVSAGSGNTADASQWKAWKKDDNTSKSWVWSDSGFTQYFSKGMNKVHLVQREGGPNVHLDKILLTNVASYVPSGLGASEPSIDIENPYRGAAVERYGRLRLVGNQLSDKNGQAVQLKGVSAHGLQWFPLVKKQSIPHIAEFFGAEAVRLAMYIEDYAPTDPSDFWGGYMADRNGMLARAESAIQDAVDAGMYVLVDWHIHNNPNNYTREAVEFFTHIAKKYGHLPNIIYEICNEPVSVSWSGGIKPYATTVINAIRQHDAHNIIIVGTPNWSQDVDVAAKDPLNFSNIMYAFHYYAATHDFNTMKNKVESALSSGAAIFVSEWGTSDVGTSRSDFNVAKQWMDYMNQRKLSWVNWSLGNKDESSSILSPRTPMSGPWSDADLTQAGLWLKPYFNAPKSGSSTPVNSSSGSSSTTSSGTGSSSSSSSSSSTGAVSSSSSSSSSGGTSGTSGNLVLEAEHNHMSQNITVFANEGIIGYFDVGDFIGFRSVDLTNVQQIKVRFASGTAGGVAEMRAGSTNGHLLATMNVYNTGGYGVYHEVTLNTNAISGSQDFYVVGKSGQGIFNLDKITLVRSSVSTSTSSSSSSSSQTASGVSGCNDGNSISASSGANAAAGVGKCLKYRHTGGQLRIGVFSGGGTIKYDVRNCNGAVTSNVSQAIGNHVAVNTQSNNCDHYVYVKEAPGNFNVQFGSW